MPALLAPLMGWSLGVLFGLLPGREPRRRGDELSDRRVVLLFSLCVYAPTCGYFLAFAEDWSYAYLLAPAKVPSAIELLLVALDAASVHAGHRLTRELLPRQPGLSSWTMLLSPGLVGALLALSLGSRLLLETSYERFQAGYGSEPLGSGPLGASLAWMGLVVTAGALVCGSSLRSRRWARGAVRPESSGKPWLGQATQPSGAPPRGMDR